jgi:hypothetical protein
VALGASAPTSGASLLYVRKPSSGDIQICVEAATRDGSYVAANTYELEGPIGASIIIPIQTRFPDTFRTGTFATFAISARVGACPSYHGTMLPVAWGDVGNSHAQTTFAVQSGRQQAHLIIGEGASAIRTECAALNQPRSTAFDALCSVASSALENRAVRVQLERCSFGECTRAPPGTVQF